MKKRLLAFLMSVCMAFSLLPIALAEGDLTPLSTPQDPTWSKEGNYTFQWKMPAGGHSQNSFNITIYKTDRPEETLQEWEAKVQNNSADLSPSDEHNRHIYGHQIFGTAMRDDAGFDCFSDDGFPLDTEQTKLFDTGNYFFTVRSLGDKVEFADSPDSIRSRVLHYEEPNTSLPSVSGLYWDWPNAKFSPLTGENADKVQTYSIHWHFSKTPPTSAQHTSGNYSYSNHGKDTTYSASWLFEQCKVGYYWFSVSAIPNDISAYRYSPRVFSPVYDLSETANGVRNSLSGITSTAPNEIRSAVQAIAPGKLGSTMLADPEVMEALAGLDEKVGGKTPVNKQDNAPEGLDTDHISVVGANLNNTTKPPQLKVGAPAAEHVLPDRYNSTLAVSFSLDLEGVKDPEHLKVPVYISIPVPANINPDFLRIIHYRATDNKPEELIPYIHWDKEPILASFVLTSFSDFTLTSLDPVLSPPEKIRWDYLLNDPLPGAISWAGPSDKNHKNAFTIQYYKTNATTTDAAASSWATRDPETAGDTLMHSVASDWGSQYQGDFGLRAFIEECGSYESGNYYARIKSNGDGKTCSDSDWAMSPLYAYQAPSQQLPKVTGLSWDWPRAVFAQLPDSSQVLKYQVQIYYSDTLLNTNQLTKEMNKGGGGWWPDKSTAPLAVWDSLLQQNGVGYYWFAVSAISKDISQIKNSEYVFSAPFHLTTLTNSVKDQLDAIVSENPDDIRTVVRTIQTTDMESALLSSKDVVDRLAVLEAKAGASTTIQRGPNAPAGLDTSKMTVTGAGLNNDTGAAPVLVVDKPSQTHTVPSRYDSTLSIQFSMNLSGVPDPENLQVPIYVKLPVPEGINPSFLRFIHYHATDRRPEEIVPNIFTDEGVVYASFVLTGFSDFVLTQLADGQSAQIPENFEWPAASDPTPSTTPSAAPSPAPSTTPSVSYRNDDDDDDDDDDYYTPTVTKSPSKGKSGSTGATSGTTPSPTPSASPASEPPTVSVERIFSDVTNASWYHGAVQYAYNNGIMKGMSEGHFAPDAPADRAAIVTMLYRMGGEPQVNGFTFRDVDVDSWYASAVIWASQNRIVSGFEDNSFRPDGFVTREQLVTMLYRFAVMKGYDVSARADLSGFVDTDQISPYAREAMSWANSLGLIQGMDWNGLYPGGTATRAQVAAIFMRFQEKMSPTAVA